MPYQLDSVPCITSQPPKKHVLFGWLGCIQPRLLYMYVHTRIPTYRSVIFLQFHDLKMTYIVEVCRIVKNQVCLSHRMPPKATIHTSALSFCEPLLQSLKTVLQSLGVRERYVRYCYCTGISAEAWFSLNTSPVLNIPSEANFSYLDLLSVTTNLSVNGPMTNVSRISCLSLLCCIR